MPRDETTTIVVAVERRDLVAQITEKCADSSVFDAFIHDLKYCGGGAFGNYYKLPRPLKLESGAEVEVGIKVGVNAKPETLQSFKQEADAAAEISAQIPEAGKVTDPLNFYKAILNIPGTAKPMGVFSEAQVSDGRPVMVTEFLRGNPLDEVARSGEVKDPEAVGLNLIQHELAILRAGRYDKDMQPRNFYIADDDVITRCDLGMVPVRVNGNLADEHRGLFVESGGLYAKLSSLTKGKEYAERVSSGKLLYGNDFPTQVAIAIYRDAGPKAGNSEKFLEAVAYDSCAEKINQTAIGFFPTQNAYELTTQEVKLLPAMFKEIEVTQNDLPSILEVCAKHKAFGLLLTQLQQESMASFSTARAFAYGVEGSQYLQDVHSGAETAHLKLLNNLQDQNTEAIQSVLGANSAFMNNMDVASRLLGAHSMGDAISTIDTKIVSQRDTVAERYLLSHIYLREQFPNFDFATYALAKYSGKYRDGLKVGNPLATTRSPISGKHVTGDEAGLKYNDRLIDVSNESQVLPVLCAATKTFLTLSLKSNLSGEEIADARASLLVMKTLSLHTKELDKLAILLDINSHKSDYGITGENKVVDVCFDSKYLLQQESLLSAVESAYSGGLSIVQMAERNQQLGARIKELEALLNTPVKPSDEQVKLNEAKDAEIKALTEQARQAKAKEVLASGKAEEAVARVTQLETEKAELARQLEQQKTQTDQERGRLAQENAQLKVRLEEAGATSAPVEKVIDVNKLTPAERLERTEQFHARVAGVLGILPREINTGVVKILGANPDIDSQEAVGLARTNALVKRGLGVVVPGQPSYPKESFTRFAGAVGLSGLKASNIKEYNRVVATLKQAGIEVVENDWLDPGDDRWY